MTTSFTDAQEMQRLHPATFEAPTADELAALRPRMHVKICAGDRERFWVLLTLLDGDKLIGTIDNDLVGTVDHGLKYGDVVTFERRHVYQIHE